MAASILRGYRPATVLPVENFQGRKAPLARVKFNFAGRAIGWASVRSDLETSTVKIPRGLDVTEVWIVEAKLRPRGHLPRRGGVFVFMISDIKDNTPHPGSRGGERKRWRLSRRARGRRLTFGLETRQTLTSDADVGDAVRDDRVERALEGGPDALVAPLVAPLNSKDDRGGAVRESHHRLD